MNCIQLPIHGFHAEFSSLHKNASPSLATDHVCPLHIYISTCLFRKWTSALKTHKFEDILQLEESIKHLPPEQKKQKEETELKELYEKYRQLKATEASHVDKIDSMKCSRNIKPKSRTLI